MLIKNVLSHPDDTHDGRTIEPYGTVEIDPEDFQLEHYQHRVREGSLLVVPDQQTETQTVEQIKAVIDHASDEDREQVKARFRELEEANPKPRQGVLDATEPHNKENSQ